MTIFCNILQFSVISCNILQKSAKILGTLESRRWSPTRPRTSSGGNLRQSAAISGNPAQSPAIPGSPRQSPGRKDIQLKDMGMDFYSMSRGNTMKKCRARGMKTYLFSGTRPRPSRPDFPGPVPDRTDPFFLNLFFPTDPTGRPSRPSRPSPGSPSPGGMKKYRPEGA